MRYAKTKARNTYLINVYNKFIDEVRLLGLFYNDIARKRRPTAFGKVSNSLLDARIFERQNSFPKAKGASTMTNLININKIVSEDLLWKYIYYFKLMVTLRE